MISYELDSVMPLTVVDPVKVTNVPTLLLNEASVIVTHDLPDVVATGFVPNVTGTAAPYAYEPEDVLMLRAFKGVMG